MRQPEGGQAWKLRALIAPDTQSVHVVSEAVALPEPIESGARRGGAANPPAHAAVFCVDEKTAIQALDRKDPVLPLSPGRAERHGFEYYRHGTLSLYAAFNTKTGEVLGKTAERHTSAEFVAFLTDIVVNQPEARRSTSLPTTFRRTRPSASMRFWQSITTFICISLRPTPHGSIRSSCGSPKSSAT